MVVKELNRKTKFRFLVSMLPNSDSIFVRVRTWTLVAMFYSKNIHVNLISQVTGKIEIQKDSIEKFKLKQK